MCKKHSVINSILVFKTSVYIDGKLEGGEYVFANTNELLFTVWAPNMPTSNSGADCVKLNPDTGMENIRCDLEVIALCESKSKSSVQYSFVGWVKP